MNGDTGVIYEPAEIMGGLYGDGIIGLKGAFSTAFADTLYADIMKLFEEARQVPGGALPRGPERWYVEVQPERIGGFVEIVTHPWFVAVCEAVLTRDYRIVEVGFDIPFPGAADQPWHRDFAVPEAMTRDRRIRGPSTARSKWRPAPNGTSSKDVRKACSPPNPSGHAILSGRCRSCRSVAISRPARR
jgi:hypothetical protein